MRRSLPVLRCDAGVGMDVRGELRVSDGERQVAADRLRAAHDEGRLDLAEYDSRLTQAYAAVTYADLDRLFFDLPARPAAVVAPGAPPVVRTPASRFDVREASARLPTVLRILWLNYAFVVAVNVTVWLLIGGDTYFWPMWLAIPGVVLAGASTVTGVVRTHRRAAIEG